MKARKRYKRQFRISVPTFSVGIFFRRYGKILGSIVLLIAGSLVLYNFITRFFIIRNVVVSGDPVELEIDYSKISRNLIFFPADTLAAKLRNDNPTIGQIYFEKKLPHTLVLVVEARRPEALLKSESQVYALDRDGVVLSHTEALVGVPIVEFDIGHYEAGQRVSDPQVQLALQIVGNIQETMPIYTVTKNDTQSLRVISEKTSIIIPQNKDIADVINTLQTLSEGFRIKGITPSMIDLRFDKPIIKL